MLCQAIIPTEAGRPALLLYQEGDTEQQDADMGLLPQAGMKSVSACSSNEWLSDP